MKTVLLPNTKHYARNLKMNPTCIKQTNCNEANGKFHDSSGYGNVDSACRLYTLSLVQLCCSRRRRLSQRVKKNRLAYLRKWSTFLNCLLSMACADLFIRTFFCQWNNSPSNKHSIKFYGALMRHAYHVSLFKQQFSVSRPIRHFFKK